MKRKIIRQGHNTMTITLPSSWIRELNLKAGDEINLIEKDKGIFLTAEKHSDIRKAQIDISEMDVPTIWKYFVSVYREGYEEILIKFKPGVEIDNPFKFFTHYNIDSRYSKDRRKEPTISAIQKIVGRFIGFEIVDHGRDFALIREMGELTEKEFDNSLRRVFLILQQMIEDTLEAIKRNKTEILSQMHEVDSTLDKFQDYCLRILKKKTIGNGKTSLYFSTLLFLELIGDEFKSISKHIIRDFNKSSLNNIKEFAEVIQKAFESYYSFFYKFDSAKVKEISDAGEKIHSSLPQTYKKGSPKEQGILHHFRMIMGYLNALVELKIEMEYS